MAAGNFSPILLVLAIVCFVCAAIGWPHDFPLGLEALGLAFFAGSFLVKR